MLIDYKNSIVSLANSILKHFGAKNEHSSLEDMDKLLEHKYKNVVVLLLDGMGMDALEYHLEKVASFGGISLGNIPLYFLLPLHQPQPLWKVD